MKVTNFVFYKIITVPWVKIKCLQLKLIFNTKTIIIHIILIYYVEV